MRQDVTWEDRKKDIPIVWYESTATDERVTAPFVACVGDDDEEFQDVLNLEAIIHYFPNLEQDLSGRIPTSALRLIREKMTVFTL